MGRSQEIYQLIYAIINVAFPLAFLGLIEEFTRWNLFSAAFSDSSVIYSEVRYGINRIYSSFAHPISYGIYLVFCIILIAYIIKEDHRLRYKVLLILCFVNLFFTNARSILVLGIVGFFIALHIQGYFSDLNAKFLTVIEILFGALIVLFAFPDAAELIQTILKSVVNVFDFSGTATDSAAGNRWELYAWVFSIMQGHELFGYGTKTPFRYVIASYEWGDSIKNSLENQYLYYYYIHGIVGLISYVFALANIVYSFYVFNKRNRDKPCMLVSMVGLLTIVYIIELFSTAQNGELQIWYTIVFATIGYMSNLEYEEMEYGSIY